MDAFGNDTARKSTSCRNTKPWEVVANIQGSDTKCGGGGEGVETKGLKAVVINNSPPGETVLSAGG